eukprot:7786357-Lingulodinium_polyedra.AAC.1
MFCGSVLCARHLQPRAIAPLASARRWYGCTTHRAGRGGLCLAVCARAAYHCLLLRRCKSSASQKQTSGNAPPCVTRW